MASTRRLRRAEQVASNAWLEAGGGFTFADVPNAATSAAVIIHRANTHRSITPKPATRSSRASSRASAGFTTIVRGNPSWVRSFRLRIRIRWINPCPGRPERCLQTGRGCFTTRERAPRSTIEAYCDRSVIPPCELPFRRHYGANARGNRPTVPRRYNH